MSYYTVLMRVKFKDNKGNVLYSPWTRAWTKKIYDSKDQAISTILEYRKMHFRAEYKIVELRIVNEFEL